VSILNFCSMDWQFQLERSRLNDYQNIQELLPQERLSSLVEEVAARRRQIRDLFASILQWNRTCAD